jgi:hypothetical protein
MVPRCGIVPVDITGEGLNHVTVAVGITAKL